MHQNQREWCQCTVSDHLDRCSFFWHSRLQLRAQEDKEQMQEEQIEDGSIFLAGVQSIVYILHVYESNFKVLLTSSKIQIKFIVLGTEAICNIHAKIATLSVVAIQSQ